MNKPIASLLRTHRALLKYDRYNATFEAFLDDPRLDDKKVEKWFAGLEVERKAVGHAFGLDTADRNSMDTCERHIQADDVRGLVAKWKSRK